jgi:acyl carrier protein phosphodiesterase
MTLKGYGNFGHYNGETLAEIKDRARATMESQAQELAWQILEYMSADEYGSWIDGQPDFTLAQFIQIEQEKLDQLRGEECTCTDPERTCPACRHAAYHQWIMREEIINV